MPACHAAEDASSHRPDDFRPAFDRSYPSIAAHLDAHPEEAESPRAMWAYYERTLLEYRPALGTPFTIWHSSASFDREDVTTIRYFDARVTSFHRATLDERCVCLPAAALTSQPIDSALRDRLRRADLVGEPGGAALAITLRLRVGHGRQRNQGRRDRWLAHCARQRAQQLCVSSPSMS